MTPTWIFDLDDTLHAATPQVFPHLRQAIEIYMQEHLRLPAQEASYLRRHYLEVYGATLPGILMHHREVDPAHFLWHTHQFPDLKALVEYDRGLHTALQRLPGRKFVFSNGPAHYVQDVLAVLGLSGAFDGVFGIDLCGYRAKPCLASFRRFLHHFRLDARKCIMVEDSLANLKAARRLGMQTVYVAGRPSRYGGIDVWVPSVVQLPGRLGKLRKTWKGCE